MPGGNWATSGTTMPYNCAHGAYDRCMTNDHERDIESQHAIIAATQRLIDASRAIDTKKSLEGIKSRRFPPRNRKHSVSHKSYR